MRNEGNGLTLSGDGRCDSPGHSAKFGSYTVIEQQTNRVLDFQLVQVGQSFNLLNSFHIFECGKV